MMTLDPESQFALSAPCLRHHCKPILPLVFSHWKDRPTPNHTRGCSGKLLSPARRRACIEQVQAQLHVSERRACAAPGQHRSTQRKVPRGREDEERLTADIIELARQYGRYGYRKIAALRASRPRSYQNLMTAMLEPTAPNSATHVTASMALCRRLITLDECSVTGAYQVYTAPIYRTWPRIRNGVDLCRDKGGPVKDTLKLDGGVAIVPLDNN